ncbi:Uncharacterised protein [Stutzerimonas stutzeri]|nr:Uncharacterised protein [Stutzerimonas stutzeri]
MYSDVHEVIYQVMKIFMEKKITANFEINATVKIITNDSCIEKEVKEILSKFGYKYSHIEKEDVSNGVRVISVFRKIFIVPYKENLEFEVRKELYKILKDSSIPLEFELGDIEEDKDIKYLCM